MIKVVGIMRTKGFLVLICCLIVFILIHVILSDFIFSQHFVGSVIPFLGGFSPSLTHDSISTRNPALEAFYAILSDLPGGYTFYFSPIMVAPPKIFGGEVNGQGIPQWIDVQNPKAQTLTALQTQQLIFSIFIALVAIICLFWIFIQHWRQKRSS